MPGVQNRAILTRRTIGGKPMNLITKLIISLFIAAVAATLTSVLLNGGHIDQRLLLLVAFFIVTSATAIIFGYKAGSLNQDAEQVPHKTFVGDAAREHGTVKWFNVTKGFGFIVKDDGEEIFVHFRSIRGEGRRGLRDGQSVNFIVAQSDKGPQAEDVVGED
jgi:cold shock protein